MVVADGASSYMSTALMFTADDSSITIVDNRAHTDMVRTREYKLAVDHKSSLGELYDLVHDPAETRNLWDDPQYLAVKAEMLLRLSHRQAFTADPLPPHEGPW